MTIYRNIKTHFLYIGAILGSGLKLGSVPIIDEIALIYHAFVNWKSIFTIKLDVFSLLIFWFFLLSLVGLTSGSVNNIRFLVISLFLIILNRKKKYLAAYSLKLLVFSSWLLLLSYLATILYGLSANLTVAWWQDYIWTGTAYVAFGLYASSVILFTYYGNIFVIVFVLLLNIFLAVITDSRIGSMMALFLFSVLVLYKPYKVKKSERFLKLIVFILLGIGAFFLITLQKELSNMLESIYLTVIDILFESNNRDLDRKGQASVIYLLAAEDPWHFIFGHGILSHQFDLAAYLPTSSDGSGRVRPTGLPAIIFDGGLIMMLLMIFSAAWAMIKLFIMSFKVKTPLYILVLCISLPFFAILSIPITNSMDMILWWLSIAPGGLSFLLFEDYCKRVKNKDLRISS